LILQRIIERFDCGLRISECGLKKRKQQKKKEEETATAPNGKPIAGLAVIAASGLPFGAFFSFFFFFYEFTN